MTRGTNAKMQAERELNITAVSIALRNGKTPKEIVQQLQRKRGIAYSTAYSWVRVAKERVKAKKAGGGRKKQ